VSSHIFISAGEVSGDIYGAELIKALLRDNQSLSFFGFGGAFMAEAGLHCLGNMLKHSAVGLTENLQSLGEALPLLQIASRWLREVKPKILILVDFQGFNLKLAKEAKNHGIPVIYLMAPQAWLWGFKGDLQRVARLTDLILSVFPAEAKAYTQAGANVFFIGHPLLDLLPPKQPTLTPHSQTICLMPGSRSIEVKRLWPILKALSQTWQSKYTLLMPEAAPFLKSDLGEIPSAIQLVNSQDRYAALNASDLVIGASGNMVLEAALLGKPVVAMYQVSGLTYLLAKKLLKTEWISLPNILLNQTLVPEYIQTFPLPDILKKVAEMLSQSPEYYLGIKKQLEQELGPSGAMQRASQYLNSKYL